MKKSRYNIFYPRKNNVLCYNSFTNSYMIISTSAYNMFQHEELKSFEASYPVAFKNFIESGFLIEESFDELDVIRFRNKQQTFGTKREYALIVYPTQDCNLKCWYCYESHVPHSIISEDVIQSIVNHIQLKITRKEIDSLQITFFGGEPLLYFDSTVYPLLKQIKSLCDTNLITFYPFFITNASLIDESTITRLKEFNPMFQITIDGNKEKHDKVRIGKKNNEPTFDKIINALHLISNHITKKHPKVSHIITLRINYDNQTLNYIDDIINSINSLDRSKVFIHLERVWQTLNSVNEVQIQLLKEAICKLLDAGFLVGHGIFGEKAYSCPAEVLQYAVINYDGLVYRCNGRTLTPQTAEGKLLPNGEIEWIDRLLTQRLAKPTYENERCINCNMLPRCMGPCSQKQLETGWKNVTNVCSLSVIDFSLEDYLAFDFEIKYHHAKNRKKEMQSAL